MKRITTGIILTVLALVAMAAPKLATAQTTQYLLGAHGCGSFTANYYCDNVPITNMDGSQPSPANADPAFVFLDLLHNGQDNQFFMNGNGGYGSYTTKLIVDQPDPSGSGVHDVDVTFTDPSVTLHFAYTKGTRHCVGRVCSTPWSLVSGMVQTGAAATPRPAGINPRPMDYWCPGTLSADVGIFLVNFTTPTPFRYCVGMYGGDFYFQQITWTDYWQLRPELGY